MIKYSAEQREKILNEFKNSDLGLRRFAREKSVAVSTLKDWVKKDRMKSFGEINLSSYSQKKQFFS